MSLKIIKEGIFDTVQDLGRTGYREFGINPGGAMDRFSAQLANSILGKPLSSPVIEIYFPASCILFEKETIICLTGADFMPIINDCEILLNRPVVVSKNCILQFKRLRSGACCYLSILHNLIIDQWLDSFSTNTKAEAGGWHGRTLKKDDIIEFDHFCCPPLTNGGDVNMLPWSAHPENNSGNSIKFIRGSEWNWMTEDAMKIFQNEEFVISHNADRMGYQLSGESIEKNSDSQLVSSAVDFGTVQLLPSGQLIVLMADHQTTGGYPRIAHIISGDLNLLAQLKPGDKIKFALTDIDSAEKELLSKQKFLKQLQTICTFKMQNLLHASN